MSPTSLTEEDVNLTLRDLTMPLFRRRRVWALTFLCVFAVAVLIGLLRRPTYESHMSILITREGVRPAEDTHAKSQTETTTPLLTDQEVNLEADSIKRDFLERVVLRNGLQNGQNTWFITLPLRRQTEAARLADAVRLLAEQIQVRTQLNVIDVTYRSTDPTRAYGVLNSLGNLYLAQHALRPVTVSHSTSNPGYEAAIEDAESGLRQFQPRPSDTVSGVAWQLATAASQLRTLEHAIAVDEQKIRTGQEQVQASAQPPAPEQSTEAANLLLRNLGAHLQAVETKRAQFLQKYPPNYALVRDADKEVSEARAAILAAQKSHDGKASPNWLPTLAFMREKLAHDQAALATHRATLNALQQVREDGKAQIKPGGYSKDDADLEHEVRADEQTYLQYLSRREQERVLDRVPKVSSALATPPTVPRSPVHGRGMIFLFALGLATAVSFPTALILDYFDDCVDPCFQTPNHVIDTLGASSALQNVRSAHIQILGAVLSKEAVERGRTTM